MKKIILLSIILLSAFSCIYFDLMSYKEWLKKTDNDKIDIYMCGYYDNNYACYWKIGENDPITLQNSTGSDSRASDIYIYGGDIYIAGSYNGHTGVYYGNACYWKNCNFIPLEAPTTNSFTNSIFVSNGDVYICGMVDDDDLDTTTPYDPPHERACYWKNGKLTILNSIKSRAKKIYVVDNDVYITGYVGIAGTDERPCYWKDDKLEYLPVPSGTTLGTAFSLYYNSGFLYTCGYYSDGTTYNICYWKNKVRTDILNSGSFCAAYAINKDHDDIEIYYLLSARVYYWKNGIETTLPIPTGYTSSEGIECVEFNGDLYACGNSSGGGGRDPVWWKNNNLKGLLGGFTANDDSATGISITYKYLLNQ